MCSLIILKLSVCECMCLCARVCVCIFIHRALKYIYFLYICLFIIYSGGSLVDVRGINLNSVQKPLLIVYVGLENRTAVKKVKIFTDSEFYLFSSRDNTFCISELWEADLNA